MAIIKIDKWNVKSPISHGSRHSICKKRFLKIKIDVYPYTIIQREWKFQLAILNSIHPDKISFPKKTVESKNTNLISQGPISREKSVVIFQFQYCLAQKTNLFSISCKKHVGISGLKNTTWKNDYFVVTLYSLAGNCSVFQLLDIFSSYFLIKFCSLLRLRGIFVAYKTICSHSREKFLMLKVIKF